MGPLLVQTIGGGCPRQPRQRSRVGWSSTAKPWPRSGRCQRSHRRGHGRTRTGRTFRRSRPSVIEGIAFSLFSLFWQRIDSERFSFAAEILGRRQLGRRKNSKPPAVLLLFPGVLLRGSASVVLSSVPGTGPCLALARVRAKREGIRTNLLKFLNLTSGNR